MLYDGNLTDLYSLAIVTWQGRKRIGIRWNVNQREWSDPAKCAGSVLCIGEPNSRGYPTWFILPSVMLAGLLAGNGHIADIIRGALSELDED